MSVENALHALRLQPKFMRNVARWVHVPARNARYAPFPARLDARLVEAMAARGISQLYAHQAEAVAAGLRGEHVAVVTPAASGKTLCYNLPILNCLLADPAARALYLYPTKALAQDQLAELRALVGLLPPDPNLPVATYDGDTPSAQRTKIRDGASVVLSNPDMLHAGILPQHPRWAAFLANLRVVVVDEMHVYRGVFGSHVANVLRRLRRVCRFYGSEPQFFLASATIANPGAVAERMVEAPVTMIGPERDGAPQGAKEIVLYNPPLLDPALGIRRSSTLEASDLAAHFLAHDVQTIVFARTRLGTELVLTALRDADEEQGDVKRQTSSAARHSSSVTPAPLRSGDFSRQSIRGYRGGYLPTERRDIERGLREGAVRAVVATNALELGIDIGQLDAAILAGYPGTIASTRQQMGRAGRRQGVAVGVLVATADAIDQYLIAHPEYVLERSPEHARLNPDNEVILAGHLACAAAELPFEEDEHFGVRVTEAQQDLIPDLLADLVEAGKLYRNGGRYFWAGEGSPSTAIGLRSSSPERVIIQRSDIHGQPQVIGELERSSVLRFLYEGAIYLHEGMSYLVERLDWEAGVAAVRPVEVDFYTRPIIGETIEILKTHAGGSQMANGKWQDPQSAIGNPAPLRSGDYSPNSEIFWGDVRVVSRATGYKILRRGTNETLGFGQIELPEQSIKTQGCWLAFSEALVERLRSAGLWLSDPNDYGPNWPHQRDAVRARDGYRCQGCGAAEMAGKQHDVHHRIPFRAFVADSTRRNGLPPDRAWEAANVLDNLVTLCPACHRRAEASVRIRSGLGGVAALLAGVAPLFLMCDPGDLGVVAEPQAPVSGLSTITIFEHAPGGVGYAEQLYRSMPALLEAGLDLVRSCPCVQGCPSCVGPVLEHDYALDAKALARAILEEIANSG
jgi:DEAD/DEAH box helicase domain-containing protein